LAASIPHPIHRLSKTRGAGARLAGLFAKAVLTMGG
jgi:hypothetical protein